MLGIPFPNDGDERMQMSTATSPQTDEPARAGDRSPTLRDVADAAGVSLATASRVLNGSVRRVAAEYRERVEREARRLGYTVNVSAQSMARGTSPIVALLVADIADPYFARIAAGVARAADEEGVVTTISVTDREPAREAAILRALRGQRPRAVILAASRTHDGIEPAVRAELDAITAMGARAVALGVAADGVIGVGLGNVSGGRALGRAMRELGYRRAVVLAAEAGARTSDDRVAGFVDGFESDGGIVTRIHRGTFTRDSGYDMMRRALDEGVSAGTLVFGISDVVAIGAMSAVRDAGRTIGADIAICGFGDTGSALDVTPTLTSLHIAVEDIGYAACRAAIDAESVSAPAPDAVVMRRDSTPRRER